MILELRTLILIIIMSEHIEQSESVRPRPVVLAVLDGWGVAPDAPGNAITRGNTHNIDALMQKYETITLHAAGEAVGLRWGEVGNSEVGHLNIGAGKVIFQPQVRIDREIIDGTFFQNPVLLEGLRTARDAGKRVHCMGLASDTGVHATVEHLYALLELAAGEGVTDLVVHAILDGRDAAYNSGAKYVSNLQERMKKIGVGKIATLSGRYYTMDRDNRWDRIERAYQAIAEGRAEKTFTDPVEAVRESYQHSVYDEEFIPAVAADETRGIEDGDVMIFFNFRADRARQISRALTEKTFDRFERGRFSEISLITFTQYEEALDAKVVFPTPDIEHPLAGVVSDAGLTQLHIAETEKYAHVTYFINGGREQPFPQEERVLVPSPPVSSYEQKPAMSAHEILERLTTELQKQTYDFYIVNFANADMVGHTGNLPATLEAVEVVDNCIGEIARIVLQQNGVLCITADHGNAEGLLDPTTGAMVKEHSALPVPFIIVGNQFERSVLLETAPDLSTYTPGGFLSDVAPTVLKIMNLPIPKEMMGSPLV